MQLKGSREQNPLVNKSDSFIIIAAWNLYVCRVLEQLVAPCNVRLFKGFSDHNKSLKQHF